MEIEQIAPKKPNFLLILILFCVSLLILFLLAYLFLDFSGKHIGLRHHNAHPTSLLALPHHSAPTLTA